MTCPQARPPSTAATWAVYSAFARRAGPDGARHPGQTPGRGGPVPGPGPSLQHRPLKSASNTPRGRDSGLAGRPSRSRLSRTARGHWAACAGGSLVRLARVPRPFPVRGPMFGRSQTVVSGASSGLLDLGAYLANRPEPRPELFLPRALGSQAARALHAVPVTDQGDQSRAVKPQGASTRLRARPATGHPIVLPSPGLYAFIITLRPGAGGESQRVEACRGA